MADTLGVACNTTDVEPADANLVDTNVATNTTEGATVLDDSGDGGWWEAMKGAPVIVIILVCAVVVAVCVLVGCLCACGCEVRVICVV